MPQTQSNIYQNIDRTLDSFSDFLWTHSDWVCGAGVGLTIGILIGFTIKLCVT